MQLEQPAKIFATVRDLTQTNRRILKTLISVAEIQIVDARLALNLLLQWIRIHAMSELSRICHNMQSCTDLQGRLQTEEHYLRDIA
jgi:hypothetical protein